MASNLALVPIDAGNEDEPRVMEGHLFPLVAVDLPEEEKILLCSSLYKWILHM